MSTQGCGVKCESLGQGQRIEDCAPGHRLRTLRPPGRLQWRLGGAGSPDPQGEGALSKCSPRAHFTHILLKRNRSSHVKARSVVITPPPPPKPSPLKPSRHNLPPAPPEVRQRAAADVGRKTASGPPVSNNHAETQLPLAARARNCQVMGS